MPQADALLHRTAVLVIHRQMMDEIAEDWPLLYRNPLAGTVQTLLVYVATYVFEFQPEHRAGLASSVLVSSRYPLTAARHREIMHSIEERSAADLS